jgi:hypothetical protein
MASWIVGLGEARQVDLLDGASWESGWLAIGLLLR